MSAYPEREPEQRYQHFIFETCTLWRRYERVDRNRSWFWPAAPLEATPVVQYALRCPDEQRVDYRLYCEMLRRLSPQAAAVRSLLWNLPPASGRLVLRYRVRALLGWLPPRARKCLRAIGSLRSGTGRAASGSEGRVGEFVDRGPLVKHLSHRALEDVLGKCSRGAVDVLRALAGALEYFERLSGRQTAAPRSRGTTRG